MKEWLRRWLPYAVIGLLVIVLVWQHTTIQHLQDLNALRRLQHLIESYRPNLVP